MTEVFVDTNKYAKALEILKVGEKLDSTKLQPLFRYAFIHKTEKRIVVADAIMARTGGPNIPIYKDNAMCFSEVPVPDKEYLLVDDKNYEIYPVPDDFHSLIEID